LFLSHSLAISSHHIDIVTCYFNRKTPTLLCSAAAVFALAPGTVSVATGEQTIFFFVFSEVVYKIFK